MDETELKKKHQPRKATKKEIELAIKGSAGIKIVVSERLKVSRVTLDSYLKRFPDMAEMLVQEREQALDMAELLVLTNIKIQREKQNATGDVVDSTDAWKLLDKMGYKRGYALAGNPSSAMDMAREAGGGSKVTIREVVVELPKDDSPSSVPSILGESDVRVIDVQAEEEDDDEGEE